MNKHKFSNRLPVLFILSLSKIVFTEEIVSYTPEEMITDKTAFLSTVNGIDFENRKSIILTGLKEKWPHR